MTGCISSFAKGALIIGVLTLLMVGMPWLFTVVAPALGWALFIGLVLLVVIFWIGVIRAWLPNLSDWLNGR